MAKTIKLKAKFIERFFFWFGVLLVGLSIYLFFTAYLKSEAYFDTKHKVDKSEPITFIPFYNASIAEHEFTNKDLTKLFGVAQYPKNYYIGVPRGGEIHGITPRSAAASLSSPILPPISGPFATTSSYPLTNQYLRSLIVTTPDLHTGYSLNHRVTLLFFNNNTYISPIRLEYYPLICGILFLILPVLGIVKRRKAKLIQ